MNLNDIITYGQRLLNTGAATQGMVQPWLQQPQQGQNWQQRQPNQQQNWQQQQRQANNWQGQNWQGQPNQQQNWQGQNWQGDQLPSYQMPVKGHSDDYYNYRSRPEGSRMRQYNSRPNQWYYSRRYN